ncbi:MAG: mechanosensitive ion channel, partial [Deltaproteobacteria bacterium]|nr:mechanosensitive ion channel [Deltaproteobacteria bacterium]
TITTLDFEERTDILLGKDRILILTTQDAKAEGLENNRGEIAAFYARQIQKAIEDYREARKPKNLLFGVLDALITTLILAFLLILFQFFFRKVYRFITAWKETKMKALQVQDLEVVSAERARDFLVNAVRWARIVLTVGLFYFYVPLVLEFFPWTRGLSNRINTWSWDSVALVGNAVWDYFPNLFIIALIVLLTHYVIKGFRFFFQAVEQGRVKLPALAPDLAMMTFKLVRFLVIAFSIVVLYPYLPGSESAAFKGVSIFVGVLFSLGSTSVVANIFAGLSLTYMRAYKIGDRVKIGETVGDVIEIKMYGTRIRTIKNVYITIPNSQILQGHIVNYSAEARTRGLILPTSVTIGYDSPWRTVHQLLMDAALKTKDILRNPPPFVHQTALNDFYVTYELNAYTDQPAFMAQIYGELHQNIQDTFNEAGMEIMSAHYMHVRDGNRTAIPDAYLPQDYEPRALRLYQNPTAGEESWRTGGKAPTP